MVTLRSSEIRVEKLIGVRQAPSAPGAPQHTTRAVSSLVGWSCLQKPLCLFCHNPCSTVPYYPPNTLPCTPLPSLLTLAGMPSFHFQPNQSLYSFFKSSSSYTSESLYKVSGYKACISHFHSMLYLLSLSEHIFCTLSLTIPEFSNCFKWKVLPPLMRLLTLGGIFFIIEISLFFGVVFFCHNEDIINNIHIIYNASTKIHKAT